MLHLAAWLSQCKFHDCSLSLLLFTPQAAVHCVGLVVAVLNMTLRSPRAISNPTPETLDLSLRKRSSDQRMDHNSPNEDSLRKASFVKAHYHPFLFAMMTFSAMAELGLTAFLISAGNENRTWPSARYHSLYDDN